MADEWLIWCFEPMLWPIFAWIIILLSTCFVWIFGFYFCILTWTKMKIQSSTENVLSIQFFSTLIVLCFMINSVLWCFHVTSSFYCIINDFQKWNIFGVIAIFFHQLGISLLYLLFVFRLSVPFQETVLATSKLLSIIFIIAFVLMVIFVFIMVLLLGLTPIDSIGWKYAFYARIALQIDNLLFTIILLSVFLKKMLLLQNEKLLKKVVRIIICASIGLLSSQLLEIPISIARLIYATDQIIFTTHVMFIVMDQTINLFSLYLQFAFATATFDKLCGKLDKWCNNLTFPRIQSENIIKNAEKRQNPKTPMNDPSLTPNTVTSTTNIDDQTTKSNSAISLTAPPNPPVNNT
eukprot:517125_1